MALEAGKSKSIVSASGKDFMLCHLMAESRRAGEPERASSRQGRGGGADLLV